MPRLLIATTIPRTLEAFLLPFSRHFRANGWRVDALSGGPIDEPLRKEFDSVFEVRWSRNPLALRNLVQAPAATRRIVEHGCYDVVHVHTPIAGFVLRLSLRPGRMRHRPVVVYTAHGFHFHEGGRLATNALFRTLERIAGRWTDHLIVINRDDERAALRHRIVPKERLHFMPGIGIDLQLYAPDRVQAVDVARVRAELGIPGGEPYFLMVAEFNRGKRHEDLLAAFGRLGRSAHLVLAGSGPLLEPTRRLARELGIIERVHFAGFRRDVPVLMRGATALVLPSEREGLPRSLMEALALEVPAIATRIRGCTDLLDDGCGFLVPVGDVPALGKALGHVLESPSDTRGVARRGRERVAAYAVEEVVRLHDELYRSVLKAR